MQNDSPAQKVRTYLKSRLDNDPEARVNTVELKEVMGFKCSDIFFDLKRSNRPVIIECGVLVINNRKVKEYRINPDGDFFPPVSIDKTRLSEYKLSSVEKAEESGRRLFEITCRKWPVTTQSRSCI